MSGPLNSIFAAIQPLIVTNLAVYGIANTTFGMSGAERFMASVPPRIVWVPTIEEFMPARGEGGDEVVDSTGQTLPGGSLPPLYRRQCNVECDIRGPNRDVTEQMIDAVVSAVHTAMVGAYGIAPGARWLTPEEVQGDGEFYRVTFQFVVPVMRMEPGTTTAVITSETVTPSSTFHVGS